jgi:hypothetical protein
MKNNIDVNLYLPISSKETSFKIFNDINIFALNYYAENNLDIRTFVKFNRSALKWGSEHINNPTHIWMPIEYFKEMLGWDTNDFDPVTRREILLTGLFGRVFGDIKVYTNRKIKLPYIFYFSGENQLIQSKKKKYWFKISRKVYSY